MPPVKSDDIIPGSTADETLRNLVQRLEANGIRVHNKDDFEKLKIIADRYDQLVPLLDFMDAMDALGKMGRMFQRVLVVFKWIGVAIGLYIALRSGLADWIKGLAKEVAK